MHSTWMQPANCRRVHAFWKEILVSVSSRTVRLSVHIWPRIGCSIFHSFSFLISDPGGCFVSDELREWASVRGIGLLTAPGEFHGLKADLENLIRVIKCLARKLADDHPNLTLASCVLWRAFHTTMVSRLEDTRQFIGHLVRTMRSTVSQRRCPLRLRLSGCPR